MGYWPVTRIQVLTCGSRRASRRIGMITYVPRNDLSAFVEGLTQTSSLDDTLGRLQQEIHDTECNFSRDPRTRFEQVRYLNSLNRISAFLRSAIIPADLTPRERLAIRGLS